MEIKTTKGYVDNKDLFDEFVRWHEKRLINPDAQMSDFIAKAIMNTANGLIRRFNFNQYTWKEEMVGDAILNCVKYVKNFDHLKYNNPHAYISRICEQTFIQRIKKEKRALAAKYKHFTKEVFDMSMVEADNVDYNFYLDLNSKVHDYEKTIKSKKIPADFDKCIYDIDPELLVVAEESFIEQAMTDIN